MADILTIPKDAQKRLSDYVRAACMIRDEGWNLRYRFEGIDRAYMRELDFSETERKAKIANRAGDPTKLRNMQVPMVMEVVDNTKAFLTGVYLTDYPIFKFGSNKDSEELALMWNTLVGEDQVQFGWAAQLNIAFGNGAKYDFAPIEVDWDRQMKYVPKSGNGPKGVVLEQTFWEGNKIYSPDPYNTVYDPRVPISQVHTKGEFVGYIEPYTRVMLKMMLAGLGDTRLKNDVEAFETPSWDVDYYVPQINPDVLLKNKNWSDGAFNWVNWVTNQAQGHIKYQNMYTVCKLYARIMPYEFGIRAPQDQTPDVWKLISVNGVMVYAQPMQNAHNFLPIVIVQPNQDNLDHQTKSQAENQVPFQEMVSALWNAKLASARRRTVDRMLYNPMLVDPDHINSPNPGAKIPVRQTAYGRKLEEAVYVFPFHDENSQYFLQEAQGVAEWGLRAAGSNRPSIGQFQKGNKLNQEWSDTMANANAPQRSQALMWENNGMHPIKEMLKSNYLQFTPQGTRFNRKENKMVNIDPIKLRETEQQFMVGDGLTPIQRLMHTDVMQQAFQAIASNPAIASRYDEGDLFTFLMESNGVTGLKDFQKDPVQLQYSQSLQQWLGGAMELAKSYSTVDELTKAINMILGPKPTPPQQPEQQQAPNQQTPNQQGTENANPVT